MSTVQFKYELSEQRSGSQIIQGVIIDAQKRLWGSQIGKKVAVS